MLYLGGGMRQVKVGDDKSITVLPDFSDPTLFYFLPNFPHIAKMEDGVPAIRLFRHELPPLVVGVTKLVLFGAKGARNDRNNSGVFCLKA